MSWRSRLWYISIASLAQVIKRRSHNLPLVHDPKLLVLLDQREKLSITRLEEHAALALLARRAAAMARQGDDNMVKILTNMKKI
jgi:hypothetical protein